MKKLSTIISPIATELAQFEVFFEQTMKAETEPMDGIMHYVQESRGKRLRPILVLLSAKLFGEVNERTLRAATFVEMMHSATLIHDDVVDDADERRGKASVKAQFGNHSAVLAGDYLLAKAILLLSHPSDSPLLNEMLRTAAAMSAVARRAVLPMIFFIFIVLIFSLSPCFFLDIYLRYIFFVSFSLCLSLFAFFFLSFSFYLFPYIYFSSVCFPGFISFSISWIGHE